MNIKYIIKKNFKNKNINLLLSISLLLIIATSLFGYNIYINNKCKDLYFATEYQMTKGNENRLLRVQNFSLVFIDNDLAIIEAYGLNKESPHEKTTYKAYFKKSSNSIWKLNKSVKIN